MGIVARQIKSKIKTMRRRKTAAYLSLGCDKNRVDTERTLAALAEEGFEILPAPAPAFALVINTCAFIDAAKQESVAAVMEAVRARQEGQYEVVAVVGCLVKRYPAELMKAVPEVDIWMGLEHRRDLAPLLAQSWEKCASPARKNKEKPGVKKSTTPASQSHCGLQPVPVAGRLLLPPFHSSFLKISEGCSAACRFCVIPRIRGRLRSTPVKELVAEARALEEGGVLELNLVAQDTTAYGQDFNPPLDLADLLEGLLEETRIPWLRLLYAHPAHLSDRVVDLLASEPRLCRYLDLPLQHVSDTILTTMGRRPGRASIITLLDRMVAKVPNLVLRTSFLLGYPGEGEREFQELLSVVEEGWFFWVGGFVFSPQEGTPAARLKNRVPPAKAQERLERLLEVQSQITARKLAEFTGRELMLLVDEPWLGGGGSDDTSPAKGCRGGRREKWWLARFAGQAPEVDGVVYLRGSARPGEFVPARITASFDYELEAEVVKRKGRGKKGEDNLCRQGE